MTIPAVRDPRDSPMMTVPTVTPNPRPARAAHQSTTLGRGAGPGLRVRGPGFPAGFLPHASGRFRRPDDGPVTW